MSVINSHLRTSLYNTFDYTGLCVSLLQVRHRTCEEVVENCPCAGRAGERRSSSAASSRSTSAWARRARRRASWDGVSGGGWVGWVGWGYMGERGGKSRPGDDK